MNKPRVFISSTIYDFADMRSALKYWLAEAGFDVQTSEHSDFDKESSSNSYDACLETIAICDYFVLLIGSRKGGMFDDEISITRKEYRVAYELAKEGKVKKIINFVRQSVWDILEDRKGTGNMQGSKLLQDPEHITSFVAEIKRIDDINNGEKPLFNWVNIFNSFSDIVNTLRNELKLNINIAKLIAEQSIKSALISNLKVLYKKDSNGIYPFYKNFEAIHEMLKNKTFNKSKKCENAIFTAAEFIRYYKSRTDKLNTFAFDDAVSSGVFLKYESSICEIIPTNFHKALIDMSYAIKVVKSITPNSVFQGGGTAIYMNDQTKVDVQYQQGKTIIVWDMRGFHSYNAIYERLMDIVSLSKYMLKYIEHHDDVIEYPALCMDSFNTTSPSGEEILQLYKTEWDS